MNGNQVSWPPNDLAFFLGQAAVRPKLEEIAHRLTRLGFDESHALDAIQDVLYGALRQSYWAAENKSKPARGLAAVRAFKTETDWWNYFLTVCANQIRQQRRQTAREIQLMIPGIYDLVDYSEDADSPKSEPPSLPPGSLEELDLKERAVFVLLREGFTRAQISRLMRVSPTRVSQLRDAAVQHLRAIVTRWKKAP